MGFEEHLDGKTNRICDWQSIQAEGREESDTAPGLLGCVTMTIKAGNSKWDKECREIGRKG